MEEQLKKLLNDYYGGFKSESYKEEVIEFIESNSHELLEILKANEPVSCWPQFPF
jgi:hypothetical protein